MRVLALLPGSNLPVNVIRSDARWGYAAPAGRALASDASAPSGGENTPQAQAGEPWDASAPQPEDAAFDAFFQRHEQSLYGYLRRILPTHEIAVEVAQETFFRAWTHFEDIQAYERPEAWLYRVATNLTISHLRRRTPLSFAQVFRHADSGEDEAGGENEVLADPLDLEEDAAARDLINRVLQCLPERQRAALLLRAVHGFSGEEVAEMLGISVANARQILSRGRARFRQLYEDATRESGGESGGTG